MSTKIMNVHVYTCYDFNGEPAESDEMRPKWESTENIDYSSMWPDDSFWLPSIIRGKRIMARYEYESDYETIADGECTEQ